MLLPRRVACALAVALVVVFLAACGSPGSASSGGGSSTPEGKAFGVYVDGADVYTAGWHRDTAGTLHASYWVNSSRVDLDANAAAYSICVSGGTVYTAGEIYNTTLGTWVPCYWTGTTRTELISDFGLVRGWASSVTTSGGTVYFAGNVNNGRWTPFSWTGNSPTRLFSGAANAYTCAIFVSGSTVYTAGQYYNGIGWQACYWNGTSRTDLPGGSGIANSIFVSGGNVYTAGQYYEGSYWQGCSWTNGERTGEPALLSYATSVFVDGGSVYVAGNSASSGVNEYSLYYYVDGVYTGRLQSPAREASVNSIYVSSGTLYSSGCYNNGSVFVPCYWTGTSRTDLSTE
jgi:hypothetical protein